MKKSNDSGKSRSATFSRCLTKWVDYSFVITMGSLLAFQPTLAYAQTVPAVTVPANTAQMDTAPNGVTVVNIVSPTASGVSHNKFIDFNVGNDGLIFNNSTEVGVTQLGGAMLANPNLGSSAKVILSEVTSGNSSNLTGFIEIFGNQAEFVLANPNGITCNGCGFINMSRASLATGTPVITAGELTDIDVNGSAQLTIEGAGLNAQDVAALDLAARTIRINAPINARDLKIFAGRNLVKYGARTVTQKSDDGSTKPALAIDAAHLGAMYANRIEILANESGVGVKMPDTLAAGNGDISITADGRIELKNASATQGVSLVSQSDNITVTGDINGGTSLSISASNGSISTHANSVIGALNNVTLNSTSLTNAGQISAGLNSSGVGTAAGNLNIQTSGSLINQGSLTSGSNLTLSAGSISSTGDIASLGTLSAQTDGNMATATIAAGTSAQLTSTNGDVTLSGTTNGGGSLSVSASSGSVNLAANTSSGALNSVSVTAQNINNAGELVAGMNSAGAATKTGDLAITATQTITNSGIFSSGNSLTARAHQLNNNEGAFLSIGDMLIEGTGGSRANAINNLSGVLETADGNMTLRADSLDNRRKSVTTSSTLIFNQTYHESSGNPPRNPAGAGISGAGWAYLPDGSTVVVPHPDRGMAYASYYDYGPITVTQYETRLNGSSPMAMLSSGGNLNIDGGTINNQYSSISANGDVAMTGTSLGNQQLNLTRDLFFSSGPGAFNRCVGGPCRWLNDGLGSSMRVERTTYDSLNSTIQAGGTITGSFTGQVNNSTISQHVPDNILTSANRVTSETPHAPSSGQVDLTRLQSQIPGATALIREADPSARHIYESRAKFANLGSFFGSDYFLSRVDFQAGSIPEKTAYDAATETRLLESAVQIETGNRWLDPSVRDASQQLKNLMDNAALAQGQLDLAVGVALTEAQIAALQNDLVWYVTETIKGQEVLVPRLYLAESNRMELTPSGALIAATNVNLTGGTLANSGDIEASDDIALTSTGDLTNRSGHISAGDSVSLKATGSLTHTTGSYDLGDISRRKGTVLQRSGQITSGGNTSMDAGKDLNILGANVAAGGRADIASGDNLTIGTVQLNKESDANLDGMSLKTSSTAHKGSRLSGKNGLNLTSGKNTLIQASQLESEADISLIALGDAGIASAADSSSLEASGKGSKTWDASGQRVVNQASSLTADGNITVRSLIGNVMIKGSNLDSRGQVTLDASNGSIALLSSKDSDRQTYKSSSSNMLWQKSRDSGHIHETVNMVNVTADGGLIIHTGNGLVVEYRDTGSLDQSVDILSKQPGLEWMATVKNRDDAVWQAIQETHRQWDYKSEGLSGAAAAVIAIAVGIATYGYGATLVGAKTALMTNLANTALSTLASQAAVSLVNNKGDLGAVFKEMGSAATLKSLATSLVTAGILQGAGLTSGGTDFASRLQDGATRALVSSLVSTAINGGDLGDNLKNSLLNAAVGAVSGELFEQIGDLAGGKVIEGFTMEEGDLRKVMLHAVVGCAAAAASKGDCTAGAIGAGLQELGGDAFKQVFDDPERQIMLSGLVSATAVMLTGGDANAVNMANDIAQQANRNNRQLHTDELNAISEEAQKLDGKNGKTADQWEEILIKEAKRRVDSKWATQFEANSEAGIVLDGLIASHGNSFIEKLGPQFRFLEKDAYYKDQLTFSYHLVKHKDVYNRTLSNWTPTESGTNAGLTPAQSALVFALNGQGSNSFLTNPPNVEDITRLDPSQAAIETERGLQLLSINREIKKAWDVTRATESKIRTQWQWAVEVEETKQQQLADAQAAFDQDPTSSNQTKLETAKSELSAATSQKEGLKRSWDNISTVRIDAEGAVKATASEIGKAVMRGSAGGLTESVKETLKSTVDVSAMLIGAAMGDDASVAEFNAATEALAYLLSNPSEIPAAMAESFKQRLGEAQAKFEAGDLAGAGEIAGALQAELTVAVGGSLLPVSASNKLAALKPKQTPLGLPAPDINLPEGYQWELHNGRQVAVAQDGKSYRLTGEFARDGRPIFETGEAGNTSQVVWNNTSNTTDGIAPINLVRVDTSIAKKGTPEYDTLNNPPANALVELDNGTIFKTGEGGYVDEITYQPVDSKGVRDNRQTAVGKEGIAGDVGGHIQACRHGGTCDRFNLFPQNSNFNSGEYRRWENEITRSLQNGDEVGSITIRFDRSNPNNARPDGVTINYSINGQARTREFENSAEGSQ